MISLKIDFKTVEELQKFLEDLYGLIGYCNDEREVEDYEENPHPDHVLQRANRVVNKLNSR